MFGKLLLGVILGGIAGVVAFVIEEPLIDHDVLINNPDQAVLPSLFLGVILGASYGFFLGAADSLTRGLPAEAIRKGLLTALVGVPGGVIALYLGNVVYALLSVLLGNPMPEGKASPIGFVLDIVPRTIGWFFFGTAIGACAGIFTGSAKRWWHSTVGGAIGGLLGGLAFQIFTLIFTPAMLMVAQAQGPVEVGAPGRAVGFPVLGAAVGFFIALVQEALKPAWVRVILGRNEGKEYPIDKAVCLIGRDEYADVPLFGDPQIAPQHARIIIHQNRHVLQDMGTPAGTLLNGQPVQQAVLKDGDIIQIASIRIQFFEKATRSLVREAVEREDKPLSRPPVPDYLCPYCGDRKHPVTGQCACSVQPTAAPSAPAAPPVPGVMPSRLVVLSGARAGAVFPLQGTVVTMGREPGRNVMLDFDPTVSRRHARLELQGNQWVLIDEGSSNGSFVNGVQVTLRPLHPGDVLRVGNTELRIE